MLEPLLMLTVLNCFFMFSSTVTTCALWWQYRRHRDNCPTHGEANSKSRGKGGTGIDRGKKDDKSRRTDGAKSQMKKLEKLISKKERKKEKELFPIGRSIGDHPLTLEDEIVKESEQLEKLKSTEESKHEGDPTSPSSDGKSTIVMEVSTLQKVVQIIDGERDHRYRMPKETITCKFSPETERKLEFIVEGKKVDQ